MLVMTPMIENMRLTWASNVHNGQEVHRTYKCVVVVIDRVRVGVGVPVAVVVVVMLVVVY